MGEILIVTITAVIGVVGTLSAIWLKHKLELNRIDHNHDCPIELCVTEDTLVLEQLRETLDQIHADRISIFSFHNGGHYYSSKSMQKMSMSYEQINNGISSTMMAKQNIPVSACITTIQPLMDNGEFWCVDTKQYPDGLCKHHLLVDGVKSTYAWPIIDLHKNIIGILRVDYVKRKTTLKEEDTDLLKQLALQLPGYLT